MTTKRSNRLMNAAAGLAALAAVASAALAWGPAAATRPPAATTPSSIPAIADPAVTGTDLVPWGSADSFQMQMQRENQIFTSVSNVLKTKHDTTKNTIQNVR